MGLISQILNKVDCGQGALLGTGGKFCPIDIETPTVLVAIEKGLKVLPAADFNLAYVRELQQKGKAYVFAGVVGFTDNTAEDEMGTREATGEKYQTLKNPYDLSFTFDRGLYSYKSLSKFESHSRYDYWIFDVQDNMFCALDSQGNLRGLDGLILNIGKYGIGKENSQTMTIQIRRSSFDNDVAWITSANLDFSAQQDLDGYNDVTIDMVAPADGDLSIVFSVKANSNNKLVPLEGVANTDLLLKVNGVVTAISVLNALTTPGEYAATVPALATADVLLLQTFDSALNADIIDLDGVLYKSNVATSIVTV